MEETLAAEPDDMKQWKQSQSSDNGPLTQHPRAQWCILLPHWVTLHPSVSLQLYKSFGLSVTPGHPMQVAIRLVTTSLHSRLRHGVLFNCPFVCCPNDPSPPHTYYLSIGESLHVCLVISSKQHMQNSNPPRIGLELKFVSIFDVMRREKHENPSYSTRTFLISPKMGDSMNNL